MANFTDLVKAQRESGKGVIGSLSGAYNQQNMQKFDVRNKLFSRSGLATALFPGLKGYQAQPISSKASGSMISPALSNSPTALSSIAKDARISARNSMALPSIARNMARMVKLMGGTPAKYFDTAAEKETAKEAKFGGSSKGGGILGKVSGRGGSGILGMLGGALGSIGSVAGSILGGIGSLMGSAASGIFSIIGSALPSGLGLIGIIAASAIGFILYQLWKNLDFTKLKDTLGLGNAFSSLGNAVDGLVKEVDDLSGGKLSSFLKEIKETFATVAMSTTAVLMTGMQMMTNIFSATFKDIVGYVQNLKDDIRLMITGQSPETKYGPGGLNMSEQTLTSGTTLEELEAKKAKASKMEGDYSFFRKYITKDGKWKTDKDSQDMRVKWNRVLDKIDENIGSLQKQPGIQSERTGNLQKAIEQNPSDIYNEKMSELMYKSTSQSFPLSSTTPTKVGKGSNISHNDAMNYLISKGGYTKEQAAGIVANLQAESGMNSNIVNKTEGSFGLAQWNPSSGRLDQLKSYAASKGKSESDPYVQLDYLMEELKNTPGFGDKQLRASSSAGDAAMIFQKSFERPKKIDPGRAVIASNLFGASGNQVASADNKPISAPNTAPGTSSGGSSLMASLAEPLQQLDKFLGGKLGLGSVNVADMLRDLSNEAKENPMFIDNSNKNISNGDMSDSSSVAANAWNKDILDAIIGRQTA
jgi:hypothetical protein